MTVQTIAFNQTIRLRPLSKQLENGVAVIGRGNQFLELPPEGIDFLTWLEQGLSLAEARARFEAAFTPFPDEDLRDVINAFLECDFIAAVDDQPLASRSEHPKNQALWIPQRWAERLFSTPVLLSWLAVTIPAVILWIATPALWPVRADYFWIEFNFVIILMGLLLWLVDMSLHELAHLLACRAKGIEASITWTQRLGFIPMSQTVMHNIWAVPRSARYLPIAAGMMWDILRLSLLIYLLFAHYSGWLAFPPLATSFLKFYLLVSTLALTAQFWLFSKMDGYFLLSALLGQRNLQGDTYTWLKSKFSRTARFNPPTGGMLLIYIYTAITLLWGGMFIGQYFLFNLPIKLQLVWESLLKMNGGYGLTSLDFADGAAVLTSQCIDVSCP